MANVMKLARLTVVLLVAVGLLACDDPPPPRTPANQQPKQKDLFTLRKEAQALRERAQGAQALAFKAVKADGSAEAKDALNAEMLQPSKANPCEPLGADPQPDPKLVALLARCALWQARLVPAFGEPEAVIEAEPRVVLAEGYAKLAMEAAQVTADAAEKARSEKEAQLKAKQSRWPQDEDEYRKVLQVCGDDVNVCKKKCPPTTTEAGVGAYCLYMAKTEEVERDFAKAADYMQLACNDRFWNSCEQIEKLRRKDALQKKHEEEQLATAFDDLKSIVNNLANRKFVAANAARIGGRTARAIPRMNVVINLEIKQNYCPQKKLAIKALGSAEFAKQAAAHCKDEAPTATALDGSQATLTNECRAVYASPCP